MASRTKTYGCIKKLDFLKSKENSFSTDFFLFIFFLRPVFLDVFISGLSVKAVEGCVFSKLWPLFRRIQARKEDLLWNAVCSCWSALCKFQRWHHLQRKLSCLFLKRQLSLHLCNNFLPHMESASAFTATIYIYASRCGDDNFLKCKQ